MTVRLTTMTSAAAIETLFATLLSGDVSVLSALDAAIGDGVKIEGRIYLPIVRKGYRRGTHVVPPTTIVARYAVVEPGRTIRLVGLAYPEKDAEGSQRPFDRTFKIGDWAEYDSFNLSYHGKIESIGPKGTVTVKKEHSARSVRLDAETFTWRNYDLDLAAAAERNFDVMASC